MVHDIFDRLPTTLGPTFIPYVIKWVGDMANYIANYIANYGTHTKLQRRRWNEIPFCLTDLLANELKVRRIMIKY